MNVSSNTQSATTPMSKTSDENDVSGAHSVENLIKSALERTGKNANSNKYNKNLKVLPINDLSHLKNHLHYLFRTDIEQKWTNELTPNNICIYNCYPEGNFEFIYADNLKGRKMLRNITESRIKRLAAIKKKTIASLAHELYQIRADYMSSTTFAFDEGVETDTVDLLKDIPRSIKGFQLICAVVHTDQKENYVHIHLLFCIRQPSD